MMKLVASIQVAGLVMVAMAIGACGGDRSNPTKDYAALKTVPKHNIQDKTGTDIPSPFMISIAGENSVNFANFIEGVPGVIQFEVRAEPQVVGYELRAIKKPADAVFSRSVKNPNLWELRWTPARGTVPRLSASARIPVEVVGVVTKATDNRFLNIAERAIPFEIVVNKSAAAPVITGIQGMRSEISEGENFAFSVVVKDPSGSGTPPELSIAPYSYFANLENYKDDGAKYAVSAKNYVQIIDSQTTQFNYIFETKGREIPYPQTIRGEDKNASALNACFRIRVLGNEGVPSTQQSRCVVIKYAAQPPKFEVEGGGDVSELKINQNNTIRITVKTDNGRGVVSVKNSTPYFSAWKGAKLECVQVNADTSVQSCELSWNVPCGTKGPKQLVLTATAKLGETQKVKTLTRDIKLIADETCAAATPAPTPAKATPPKATPAPTPVKATAAPTPAPAAVKPTPAPTPAKPAASTTRRTTTPAPSPVKVTPPKATPAPVRTTPAPAPATSASTRRAAPTPAPAKTNTPTYVIDGSAKAAEGEKK